MKRFVLFVFLSTLLFSCAPTASPTPAMVTVYATPAAEPWLADLYACADAASVVLNVSPDAPQIFLRVGAPVELVTPAFQIGAEDLLVAVQRASPVGSLTGGQVRLLFSGRADPSLRVWVYASGADLQEVFDQAAMQGRSVVSSARVAVDPRQMSEALNADANAVGILPRHWLAGDVREVFVIPSVPVLAITPLEPQGVVRDLIACLQK